MRNASIAQWILSQVTPPDRAASTVGDLMEETSARGLFWFWSCVFRTTLSILWSEVAAAPFHLAGLVFRGWLLNTLLLVPCLIALSIAIPLIASTLRRLTDAGEIAPPSIWISKFAGGLGILIGGMLYVAYGLRLGQWIARRAPGRELAACLVLISMEAIVTNLVVIGFRWGRGEYFMGSLIGLVTYPLLLLVVHIPLFAGAVWVRRQSLWGGSSARA